MPIALSILGATGKMGQKVIEVASRDPQFQVNKVFRHDDVSHAFLHCDVAIDFTSPHATKQHLEAALRAKKALVIGTTGHTEEEHRAIANAAQFIPVLFSPNFSCGIALCLEAIARFGQALCGRCTIHIVETHHAQKKDRPSGTALAFAEAACQGNKKDVPIHSIRAGNIVGEHQIIFECDHERIELKHTTHSRDAFAQGALKGAKFLVHQPPGLYTLKDLF